MLRLAPLGLLALAPSINSSIVEIPSEQHDGDPHDICAASLLCSHSAAALKFSCRSGAIDLQRWRSPSPLRTCHQNLCRPPRPVTTHRLIATSPGAQQSAFAGKRHHLCVNRSRKSGPVGSTFPVTAEIVAVESHHSTNQVSSFSRLAVSRLRKVGLRQIDPPCSCSFAKSAPALQTCIIIFHT